MPHCWQYSVTLANRMLLFARAMLAMLAAMLAKLVLKEQIKVGTDRCTPLTPCNMWYHARSASRSA